MTNVAQQKRPKFLNLLRIHMPVTAVVSILHRASGLLFFLCLPVLIYLLGRSFKSAAEFRAVLEILNSPLSQLVIGIGLLALVYHLIAGIRFLLMDIDVGHSLKAARYSAWLTLVITAIFWLGLLLARCVL